MTNFRYKDRVIDHGVRIWAFLFQAFLPLFLILVAFLILGKANHLVLYGNGRYLDVLSNLQFDLRFGFLPEATLIQVVFINGTSGLFSVITVFCIIDILQLVFLPENNSFLFFPRFAERLGFVIVDRRGEPVRGFVRLFVRRLLTYGIFYGGLVWFIILVNYGTIESAVSVLFLWGGYWVLQVTWLELHKERQALHDVILKIWKLEGLLDERHN